MSEASKQKAIIVGAGPAGLTAALELLRHSDIQPIVLEKSDMMGGISRTVNYKGNRIDIGGHRFFSKSDRVMEWWLDIMPMEHMDEQAFTINYQNQARDVSGGKGPSPDETYHVMLVRSRKSRIYFLRKFFDYPLKMSVQTLANMGLVRTFRVGVSYVKSMLFPIRNESNLEEFFINRFGRQLYKTFFKSYTEKVWGIECNKISAEWGAQRIKGLSILSALGHALKSLLPGKQDISQKKTETSLIERFLYPKHGPGQLWERVADMVREQGGQILTGQNVETVHVEGQRIVAVSSRDENNTLTRHEGDYFFSTMPVQELVRSLDADVPPEVTEVNDGLLYRDFLTVGLLLDTLKITEDGLNRVKDNWIYIQEPDVKVGRLQIFNNWSPYMVADASQVWVGLEYFCNEGDELWSLSDEELKQLGREELDRIDIIDKTRVSDATVVRMPKTYPAYFGTYDRFDVIRNHLDQFGNLFLIGRNGMHRYNNQDHSMLTAMVSVENILQGNTGKDNIWEVNTEMEYHESK